MKKAILTSMYQDVNNLERLRHTIPDDWLWIVIDGKHHDDKTIDMMSTDGSREIIEGRKNSILEDVSGYEWMKRQAYLNIARAEAVDIGIVVDSDEYFHECNFEGFEDECKSKGLIDNTFPPCVSTLKCWEVRAELRLPVARPRVFFQPGELIYNNEHHYQVTYNNMICNPSRTFYSVRLYHDSNTLRDWERKDAHDDYIKWLSSYENSRIETETEQEKEDREKCIEYGY